MELTRRVVLTGIGASMSIAGCIGRDGETGTDGDENADAGEMTDMNVYEHDELGNILVGPGDAVVYMFDGDEQAAGESACHDDCAENWPPYVVPEPPTAGDDVLAQLRTFERADRDNEQVAANGWPLYFRANDENPGEAGGQGANGAWWVLDPVGHPVRVDPSADSTDS